MPGRPVRHLPETLCFHAQQAVEKAIKAVLVSRGIAFPRSHNVGILLELLPSSIQRDAVFNEAAALTDYAVSSRYPGEAEDVTLDELAKAIAIAEAVCVWATRLIIP